MKPIVIVGSINMDMVSRVGRMPVAGETIIGDEFQTHSGGKGANQAVAVARLGHPAILLGKVGSDVFGKQLRETLSAHGVDVSEVEEVEGSSGTASIVVDDAGENSIIVIPGANLAVDAEYLERKRDVLAKAGLVLAQLEIPLDTIATLTAMCDELGVPVMLDPAPAQALDAEVLARVSWFTPNETEAEFYTGRADEVAERSGKLPSLGVRNTIFKQGARGASITLADGTHHAISSFAVEALDTTAAGDAYNGAYAVGLMRGYDAKRCGEYAAAAAAISVTRHGAQASMATEDEVQMLLQSAAAGAMTCR